MARIINFGLSSSKVNKLFDQLTLEEMESTLGGNIFIPLCNSNYEIVNDLFNVLNNLNNNLDYYLDYLDYLDSFNPLNNLLDNYLSPFSFDDNKILTIDFSGINIYLIS